MDATGKSLSPKRAHHHKNVFKSVSENVHQDVKAKEEEGVKVCQSLPASNEDWCDKDDPQHKKRLYLPLKDIKKNTLTHRRVNIKRKMKPIHKRKSTEGKHTIKKVADEKKERGAVEEKKEAQNEMAFENQGLVSILRSHFGNIRKRAIDSETTSLSSAVDEVPKPKWFYSLTESEKISEMTEYYRANQKAAELKLAAYVSACQNLKTLAPFPFFVASRSENGCKELQMMNAYISEKGGLEAIINNVAHYEHYEKVINVLYWLLRAHRNPMITLEPTTKLDEILSKISDQRYDMRVPTLFKLSWHIQTPVEIEWSTMSSQKVTRLSFFGCPLKYLHAVIHYGLFPNLTREGIYGQGFYLTDDLEVALQMSNIGFGTVKNSEKIVLVVEFVRHPSLTVETCFPLDLMFSLKESVNRRPVTWHFLFMPKALRVRYILNFSSQKSMKHRRADALRNQRFAFQKNLLFLSVVILTVLITFKTVVQIPGQDLKLNS